MTATAPKLTPVKIRLGLYDLGLTHTAPRFPGAPACGGRILAERVARAGAGPGPTCWECFCETCEECDPNGWPTLLDCVREAPEYWAAAPAKE